METNLEKLEKYLETSQIPTFNNSNVDFEYLQLPKDLTILPTAEISKYLNALTQQKMYIRTLASQARAVYREAKSNFDKEKCRVFVQAPAKMSVTEKELRVFQDAQAEQARTLTEYALEKYDYLKDIMESYNDGLFLVSRELTRRMKDTEDLSRNGRFNA